MEQLFDSIGAIQLLCLILALGLGLAFEFVNGFHDTANAVATVIYTNNLPPWAAVIWSDIWNRGRLAEVALALKNPVWARKYIESPSDGSMIAKIIRKVRSRTGSTESNEKPQANTGVRGK